MEVALRKESVDRNFGVLDYDRPSVVALRKESVDRNADRHCNPEKRCKSLSARRAWIEIRLSKRMWPPLTVALRKESVDRNVFGGKPGYCNYCRSPQGERG